MPTFDSSQMTTIQAYQDEAVVIHNATTKITFEILYSSPDLHLTFKNLRIQGIGAPLPLQNWQPDPQRPNVWRTPFTDQWLGGLLFDNPLYAYACASLDALNASCRWYHDGQADATPDGEPFIRNGMVSVYSPEGNPATAFMNSGIRPANGAGGSASEGMPMLSSIIVSSITWVDSRSADLRGGGLRTHSFETTEQSIITTISIFMDFIVRGRNLSSNITISVMWPVLVLNSARLPAIRARISSSAIIFSTADMKISD